jgi:mannose-6-phosphate isomerase-like protein (cupin superfamily)
VTRLVAQPFDFSSHYVQLSPGGGSEVIAAAGPPPDVPGYLAGLAEMTQPPPHGGECHEDGDELLVVVTGSVVVTIDGLDGEHAVSAGEAFLVPRGMWHQVRPREPSRLLFVTPGPHSKSR